MADIETRGNAERRRGGRLRPLRTLVPALALALAGACSRPAPQAPIEIADPGDSPGWLVRGPFSSTASTPFRDALDQDFLEAEGGEAAVRPGRIQSADAANWREVEGDPYGLDFLAAFAENGSANADCVAYAFREIESAESCEAVLKLGSDDGAKVWINGALVFANRARRALKPDEDAVIVSLSQGKNRVLVKVGQAKGAWGFSLRVRDVGEDRAEGETVPMAGIRLAIAEREVGDGEPVRGYVMVDPAFAVDGAASVELVDAAGAVLASIEAPLFREFSLSPPPGLFGPLSVIARGEGPFSGLVAAARAFSGDALAAGSAAAARARARAASIAHNVGFPDEAATLSFLADLVDGRLPSPLSDFDAAVPALAELEMLAPADGGPVRGVPSAETLDVPGLGRYAFRSTVDRSLQPFSLYQPTPSSSGARPGLLVVLHGMGGDDEDAMRPFAAASPRDLVVLAPYARGDLGYAGPAGRDLADLIEAAISRYAIDRTRIYATGSSMGGFGTWKVARSRPGFFAAIAPFAGWTDPAGLEPLADTNVLAVHGGGDSLVPAESSILAAARLEELGAPVNLQILEGVGHDALSAWLAGRGAGRLLEWFNGKIAEPWPAAVSVRASMAAAGTNRWVSVTGLVRPREPAGLDARVADPRHIVVETTNVASFELDLAHPSLARGGRILVLADGINLTADAGRRASFALGAGDRFRVEAKTPPVPARNGGSGLAALFEGELEIVYGTRVARRADGLREAAEALADWGPAPGRTACQVLGSFPVRSDSGEPRAAPDAPPSSAYAKGGRILIGSPEENAALARIASRLPVSFSRKGFEIGGRRFDGGGFLLVQPDPERPSALVAVFVPPAAKGTGTLIARSLASSLREYSQHDDAGGASTPDIMVFDDAGSIIWAASYNRDWSLVL